MSIQLRFKPNALDPFLVADFFFNPDLREAGDHSAHVSERRMTVHVYERQFMRGSLCEAVYVRQFMRGSVCEAVYARQCIRGGAEMQPAHQPQAAQGTHTANGASVALGAPRMGGSPYLALKHST